MTAFFLIKWSCWCVFHNCRQLYTYHQWKHDDLYFTTHNLVEIVAAKAIDGRLGAKQIVSMWLQWHLISEAHELHVSLETLTVGLTGVCLLSSTHLPVHRSK